MFTQFSLSDKERFLWHKFILFNISAELVNNWRLWWRTHDKIFNESIFLLIETFFAASCPKIARSNPLCFTHRILFYVFLLLRPLICWRDPHTWLVKRILRQLLEVVVSWEGTRFSWSHINWLFLLFVLKLGSKHICKSILPVYLLVFTQSTHCNRLLSLSHWRQIDIWKGQSTIEVSIGRTWRRFVYFWFLCSFCYIKPLTVYFQLYFHFWFLFVVWSLLICFFHRTTFVFETTCQMNLLICCSASCHTLQTLLF